MCRFSSCVKTGVCSLAEVRSAKSRRPHARLALVQTWPAFSRAGAGCRGLDHRNSWSSPSQPGTLLPSSCGRTGPFAGRVPEGPSRRHALALALQPRSSSLTRPVFPEEKRTEKQGSAFHVLLFCLRQFFWNFRQIQPSTEAHPDPEEVSWPAAPRGAPRGPGALTDLTVRGPFPRPRPGNSIRTTTSPRSVLSRKRGKGGWSVTAGDR